jgi:hypothetical protein
MLYFNSKQAHLGHNLLKFYASVQFLPDDDLVEVETCVRNISDKSLLVTDCAVVGSNTVE